MANPALPFLVAQLDGDFEEIEAWCWMKLIRLKIRMSIRKMSAATNSKEPSMMKNVKEVMASRDDRVRVRSVVLKVRLRVEGNRCWRDGDGRACVERRGDGGHSWEPSYGRVE
jgi:hypothetical protein